MWISPNESTEMATKKVPSIHLLVVSVDSPHIRQKWNAVGASVGLLLLACCMCFDLATVSFSLPHHLLLLLQSHGSPSQPFDGRGKSNVLISVSGTHTAVSQPYGSLDLCSFHSSNYMAKTFIKKQLENFHFVLYKPTGSAEVKTVSHLHLLTIFTKLALKNLSFPHPSMFSQQVFFSMQRIKHILKLGR